MSDSIQLDDYEHKTEGRRTTFYNVTGAAIGALLAALSMLGLVATQSSVKTDQTYTEVISYDS